MDSFHTVLTGLESDVSAIKFVSAKDVPEAAKSNVLSEDVSSDGATAGAKIGAYLDSASSTLYVAPTSNGYEIYAPESCNYLFTTNTTFKHCSAKELVFESFNTSNVTSMIGMICGMTDITVIDLSGWDTSNVKSTTLMFYGCSALKTIWASSENPNFSNVTSGGNMFGNCKSLVGGNGTAFSTSNVKVDYAHIDVAGNPGYFTDESKKTTG